MVTLPTIRQTNGELDIIKKPSVLVTISESDAPITNMAVEKKPVLQ